MKHTKVLFTNAYILILLAVFSMHLSAQKTATVLRVKDGDTYVLKVGARELTVRMKNIDAPEKSDLERLRGAERRCQVEVTEAPVLGRGRHHRCAELPAVGTRRSVRAASAGRHRDLARDGFETGE